MFAALTDLQHSSFRRDRQAQPRWLPSAGAGERDGV